MARISDPLRTIESALDTMRDAFEALASENARLREQLESIVRSAATLTGATMSRRGRPAGRVARASPARSRTDGPRKRGRAFKFSDEQAAEFRKQVEGGKSARAIAKELKISLPTMYNTLKRAGWKGRPGRKPKAA